jgi:hypothetical protein
MSDGRRVRSLGAGIHADEMGGQSLIGQVLLVGPGEAAQMVAVGTQPGPGSSVQSWERTGGKSDSGGGPL